MERLGDEVRSELQRFGSPGGMPDLIEVWPDLVGEMVAANAWPARVAGDGTLHVNTSSSTWAYELTQLAPEVLGRLRATLGERAPKALRFAPGHLPEPATASEEGASPKPREATPEALQTAASLTAEVADDELRDRIARAAALSLSRGRSDSPF